MKSRYTPSRRTKSDRIKKVTEYCVAYGSLNELEHEVAELLSEGWQPYGDPYVLPGAGIYTVCQAMVKYAE